MAANELEIEARHGKKPNQKAKQTKVVSKLNKVK